MAPSVFGFRRMALLGAAVATVALVLTAAGSQSGATTSKETSDSSGSPAQELLLRLHDLPPGYLLFGPSLIEFPFSGINCNSLEPADPRPRLAAFLARYSPSGCLALYFRLFRIPGSRPAPLSAGTGAMEMGDVEGARAGLTVSRELLSHLLGDELPTEVAPPETVGDATRLYHWDQSGLFAGEEASSFLVWRSGSVVASVFVAGGRSAANDRAAVELARSQQGHIEAPAPYTPAEQDDTEVALEDPALNVPVYWLGRTLTPGRGLRRLRLFDTTSSTGGALRAPRASLFYVDRLNLDRAEGIRLDIWSRRQWRQLGASRGSLPGSVRCPTARRVKIPTGRAVIFGGTERVRGACPDRAPDLHAVRIYLPDVVVTAATTLVCATCTEPGKGPYNSFKGMATIARRLELRPRPVAVSP